MPATATLEVVVRPPWPYRLPRGGRGDGVTRLRGDLLTRLLHVDGLPLVVHAWQPALEEVRLRAADCSAEPGAAERLEIAIERMRFALAVDDDLREFYDAFRADPLVGPGIRWRPWRRPKRRPWPWEALAWAVTEQLIQVSRATQIQRRIVRRWGPEVWPAASSASRPGAAGLRAGRSAPRPGAAGLRAGRSAPRPGAAGLRAGRSAPRPGAAGLRAGRSAPRPGAAGLRYTRPSASSDAWTGPGPLRDVPSAAVIAGRAPAELASMDLAPARCAALVKCAREVAAGRADLLDPDSNARLERIPEIGPWTLQCLGYMGRGDPDSLPAGDLAYVKLVGYLTGLGRRATVEEVEEYFAPYAPFRGLAGTFALSHWGGAMGAGPPAALAA